MAGAEYHLFHRNLCDAMRDGKMVLKQLCADDHRNDAGGRCTYCGRKGSGTSKEISLEQLIDAAALVGVLSSTGTLANSNLSSDCSRLKKHGQSLAALSSNNFIDVLYTNFENDAVRFLEEHQRGGDEEDDLEDSRRTAPIIKEEGEEKDDLFVPDLVALYRSERFGKEMDRFYITGAALHAQPLKYRNPFTDYKDQISHTFTKSHCSCVHKLLLNLK